MIDAAHRGQRLDRVLATQLPDLSRGRIQALLKAARVLINGRTATLRERVKGHENIQLDLGLDLAPIAPQATQGEPLALSVLYADDHIIVVDKPAGLVVHPGAGNPRGTLMNALLHRFPQLAALPRAGIVQRLDKNTSGVMVVAASWRAHKQLINDLGERTVSRQYLAIVNGIPSGGGSIDAPVGRDPHHRTRMAIVGNGREAITRYTVTRRYAHHAALTVNLLTGRTHQIRVHMAHIGYPITGDRLYAGRAHTLPGVPEPVTGAIQALGRQALHAHRLTFKHPADGTERHFEAAIPADIAHLRDQLERHAHDLASR
ncbi:MAG: RluA family pseudouridine synthase [Gammaproteobacteria bacterium]|nr:RluA family pseudouridine synthase [Gammaproteobacteria bacterium]